MANANTKAKARTIATRQMLKQDRMSGFRTTASALDAIYGNLSTTQRGIGRSQTIANQRTLAALGRLAGKTSRSTGRIVRGSERMAANAYGSVVGAAVDKASGTLEAHAAAARATLAGEAAAGKVGAKGASDVLAITKAGAATAKAGAAGQLADALAYRARQDAQVIAGMQQARLEAQLQFQNWKRQQDYLAKQEAKDTRGQLGGIVQATNTTATAGAFMRKWLAENPGSTAPEALQAYQTQYGVVEAATPLLTLVSQNVYDSVDPETGLTRAGYTRDDESHDLVNALHTLYPNFANQRQAVFRTIDSALARGYADVKAAAAETAHPDYSPDAQQVLSGPVADETGRSFGANPDSVQAATETGAHVTTTHPQVDAQAKADSAQKALSDYTSVYWSQHKPTEENQRKLEADPTFQRLLANVQAANAANSPF